MVGEVWSILSRRRFRKWCFGVALNPRELFDILQSMRYGRPIPPGTVLEVSMQVFAVFNVRDPSRVKAGIDEHYRDNCHEAGNDAFFIATSGETTRQVATKLGLGDDNPSGVTTGIIIPVTGYWGRYSSDLWEWIVVKQNANGG